jgi:release factor glutamine methyltransferase
MNQTVNNLKDIPLIQKTLKKSGYYDIERISKEIAEYCSDQNIPIKNVLREIEKDKPWEYIKGQTEFFGNKFFLNSSTLIPRIETEQIVEIATDFLNSNPSYKYVIDVGTGSGCIIISLIKKLCTKNTLKFFATDINSEALEIAKKNSMLHKVNEKVSFIKDNLIKDININDDVFIIANLPYVPTSMYEKLDKSVKDYEPQNAIDGGEDGLKYYKELLEQIKEKKLLKYRCTLLIEIESSTIDDVKKLFSHNKSLQVYKDFRDKERFCLIHLS